MDQVTQYTRQLLADLALYRQRGEQITGQQAQAVSVNWLTMAKAAPGPVEMLACCEEAEIWAEDARRMGTR